ncbi:phage tail tape measure protein [Agrobacterium rosae]|uniref:Tail tape measure protein n=1 Tax=Agrobacterium rosae TaxID=1972867 RepID=A0AAW9F7I7_9HYPH|nr:hypothetical protein [Agrobacterium rosae]MDX8301294.1 hypothetical protein [Agrobacterium rosae]
MDDEERLVILLEARIKDLERNMARASGTTEREFRKMSMSSKRATSQMEEDAKRSTSRINQAMSTVSASIGTMGKAFAGGIAGAIIGQGIAGTIERIREVARGVAEIGDQAKMAGLSLQAFQELRYVAEQNRLGVDSLTDGIKELNLRADEFVATGGGSAAEAFGRLGYSADMLKTKLKDPQALFIEIIGLLGQLDRAAQIRISDELFGGTGGEKFVQLIEQGQVGIRKTIKEARDLGVVMDDEVIARADELDKAFNKITTSVGTGLKTAIVETAAAMQSFIGIYQGWVADYEKRKNAFEAGARMGAMIGTQPDPNRVRTTDKTGRLPEAAPVLPSQEQLSTRYLADYRAELALTNRERSIAAESEKILSDASSKGLAVTKAQAEALAREKVLRDEGEAAAKKSGGARDSAAKRAETEKEKIQELISELEEELRLVGASEGAKRAAAASRHAGAAATEEERARIVQLTEAIYTEEEARSRSQEQAELYHDLTKSGLDDLFSAIESGKSFWQAMGDVAVNSLKRIADTLLDDVLDALFKVNGAAGGSGGGFLSSLFSGIFGGGTGGFTSLPTTGPVPTPRPFAKGGAFANGISGFSNQVVNKPTLFAFAKGAGLMGEAGEEAIMPLSRDSSGRLGVSVNGGSGAGTQSTASGGTSEVVVSLSPELVGQILSQAQNSAVKIVQKNNANKAEQYKNGGTPQ